MSFHIDKQTSNDLELFEKAKGEKSIFSLFNFTKSIGGKRLLEHVFSDPLTDLDLIENRLKIISFLHTTKLDLDIDKENLDFIECYLSQKGVPKTYSMFRSFINACQDRINPRNEYYIIQRGVRLMVAYLNELYCFAKSNEFENAPDYFKRLQRYIIDIIDNTSLKVVLKLKNRRKFFPNEYGKLDHCFREKELKKIQELLHLVYEMDVYKSIAYVLTFHKFSLPVFTKKSNVYQVQGLFHPFIDNPVSNDFEFIPGKNVCFLTGPNMAGKSTFLKSLSISVYLAHLGFPVPAKSLSLSVFDGLFTTINLADNLNKGYSHFYNEVLRVKYVAEQLNKAGNVFVVFDELFRGTNVKDAYEASLSVISAFSKLNKGMFAVSTHIIEIAEELIDNNALFFKYFEANLVNEVPQYTYRINDGVTDERIGMYILRKEKVIETIENSI